MHRRALARGGALAALAIASVASIGGAAASGFADGHACSRQPSSEICVRQQRVREVDLGRNSDLYIVPHRGLWGVGNGAAVPENSVPAILGAADAGYDAVELDILKVRDGFVASHDFILPRLTESASPGYMWDMSVAQLAALRLRDRAGALVATHLMTLDQAFAAARQRNVILMIDTRPIKAHFVGGRCVANCSWQDGSLAYDEAYMANIAGVIDAAIAADATPYLVFKVPYPLDYVKAKLGDRFARVLWMPQANPTKLQWYLVNHGLKPAGYRPGQADMVEFVDQWLADAPSISAFETAFSASDDVRLQPFERAGVAYQNLLEYILKIGGRRPGTFSGEPVGPRGLVNEYGDWRATPDARADHLAISAYPFAKYMVVTTDRPDVWADLDTAFQ